jgi:hypothetical protein
MLKKQYLIISEYYIGSQFGGFTLTVSEEPPDANQLEDIAKGNIEFISINNGKFTKIHSKGHESELLSD